MTGLRDKSPDLIIPTNLPPLIITNTDLQYELNTDYSGNKTTNNYDMIYNRMFNYDTFFWSSVKSYLSRYIMKA